jgi:hypothetical protein
LILSVCSQTGNASCRFFYFPLALVARISRQKRELHADSFFNVPGFVDYSAISVIINLALFLPIISNPAIV